jgi:hypothetical protein
MDYYTFRVVSSGPCAYVPNTVKSVGGNAASWSVILPNLKNGYEGDDDGIPADRHRAALIYSPDDFDVNANPDAILSVQNKRNIYKFTTLFFLDGHRVTFELPGADDLTIEDVEIDKDVRSDPDKIKELIRNKDALLRSMDWLPAMKWLRSDLQWFGSRSPADYFLEEADRRGYPNRDRVAAHILLKNGKLGTDQLDMIGDFPTIWQFQRHKPLGKVLRTQALANSIALEVKMPEDQRAKVTITYPPDVKKILTLKKDKLTGTRSIEIKNRELEAIFLPEGLEVEHPVDFDFRYLYGHGEGYRRSDWNFPLPHELTRGGGNEVGTCGGHGFSGFADSFSDVLKLW